MNEFVDGFKKGFAEGWRGYFAPLRLSPWIAAWRSIGTPGSTWATPFRAWFEKIERIIQKPCDEGKAK